MRKPVQTLASADGSDALWQVEVRCPRSCAEAVAQIVAETWQVTPVVEYRPGRPTACIRVYLPPPPAAGQWTRERSALRARLRELRRAGNRSTRCSIRARLLAKENWAESWKRHFHVLRVGPLVVRASWQTTALRPGQCEVVLDPGLSFGTGHHPTTRYCLEELVRRRIPGQPQPFLDAGTGSGILAIAAAKLGYDPVDALDYDPATVRTALANAEANGVSDPIRIRQADLLRLPGRGPRYGLICANVTAPVLLAARERLVSRLAPGGWLAVAGILDREFDAVRRAYEGLGLVCVRSRRDGRWRSGTFSKAES